MRHLYAWMTSILLAIFFTIPAFAFAAENPAANVGDAAGTSRNWSGYVATNGTFTGVSGSWTVPAVAPSESAQADATWVGIGGVSSSDLIQIGTQAIAQSDGTSYEAWYELLPGTSIPISMQVNAGDVMSASILQQGTGSWLVSIHDNTNDQSFSTTLSYSSSLSSAEWIEEMPSDQLGYIPLDSFGSVSFTGATAIKNGSGVTPADANAYSLTMIASANQALATTSSLGGDGSSFTVTRSSISANVAPRTVRGDGRGGFRRGGGGGSGAPSVHVRRARVFLTPTLFRIVSGAEGRFEEVIRL
ncbi:MAG: G1 family glutamic endopeptidase [Minisyncoccia bacterium]